MSRVNLIAFLLLLSTFSFAVTKMEEFSEQLEKNLLSYQPQVCAIKVISYSQAKPISSIFSKATNSLVQVICDGGVHVENRNLGLIDSDRVQTMAGAAVSQRYGFTLKSCVNDTCFYSK